MSPELFSGHIQSLANNVFNICAEIPFQIFAQQRGWIFNTIREAPRNNNEMVCRKHGVSQCAQRYPPHLWIGIVLCGFNQKTL